MCYFGIDFIDHVILFVHVTVAVGAGVDVSVNNRNCCDSVPTVYLHINSQGNTVLPTSISLAIVSLLMDIWSNIHRFN